MADTYYITTAIAYPNGRPHIGHAYEAVAADAIARFQRMQGHDVRFVTGTDEHGLKMVKTAREQGVEVQALCDEMSSYFKQMCDTLNVSYDRFIRTTEPAHHAASVALWEAMQAPNADGESDLYLDRYEGWYSVRDEAFYEEKELIAGEGGVKLSPQGTPVEWTAEESWFFRLSNYAQPLLDHYKANPDFIRPESRRNEVVNFVEGGLRDLSVSRTSFDWGVKVPGSPEHVMYVWVDALTAYMSALGYPDQSGDWGKYWPADLHLIGKDIVRFHTVYWPAFLMSAGLPLPKQVFGHGFLLARGGEKMSKSLGNVVDPIALAERYGVDALRYFFLREVSFGQDGTWSEEAIVARCNAELANSFGNLAQRTLSLIYKNLDGRIPLLPFDENTATELALYGFQTRQLISETCMELVPNEFNKLAISLGIERWMGAVYAANQFIDTAAPWALRKTDPEQMERVLATVFILLRDLAIAIRPVVPATSDKLLDQMGILADERDFRVPSDNDWYLRLVESEFRLEQPVPLFPRLELLAETTA